MKTIKEIGTFDSSVNYTKREAARAVITDGNGKISLVHAGKYDYYKIPGGGIESGENIELALEREIAEEAGIKAKVIGELGKTIEYRNEYSLHQISYAYYGELLVDLGSTDYTELENKLEFSASWVELDVAIDLLKKCTNPEYFGDSEHELMARYMVARDLAILEEYKKELEL